MSKRAAIILLCIGIFTLSGCNRNNDFFIETEHNDVSEESHTSITNAEDNETLKPSESLPKPSEVPVSTRMEDILYHSVDDIDISLSIHRCKSDGKNIYLVYGTAGEADLYAMPVGTNEHSQMNIDNPEEMVICHIAIDTYERIHLLVAGSNYDKWFIWRLNENYQIDRIIDISSYFEIKQMPHWFLVDKEGMYYLQWVLSRDGIIIDSDGELQHKFTLKSLETRWTYEAAVGKDGRIYLVYGDGDGKLRVGELDIEDCTIKREDSSLCFTDDEVFSEMSRGTDTNLLLFSPFSGVWAYDQEKNILENRVPLSDIDYPPGTNFYPLTFLPDGRLLLLGNIGSDIHLTYIPAGK